MFGFFKKMNKKLNNEHVALIMQCESFFIHADSLIDGIKNENKEEGLLADMNIDELKKELDVISKKKEYSKALSNDDGAKLLEINKDCRRLFDQYFNFYGTITAFDDQFTPVRYKLGMDMDT